MNLLRPTPEQYDNFVEHIANAHSWYKHLPIWQGTPFTLFFDPNAGSGYTEENPRPHYSWKTTEEYRKRFGSLAYRYGMESRTYRDGHTDTVMTLNNLHKRFQYSPADLEDKIIESCTAKIFPWIHSRFPLLFHLSLAKFARLQNAPDLPEEDWMECVPPVFRQNRVHRLFEFAKKIEQGEMGKLLCQLFETVSLADEIMIDLSKDRDSRYAMRNLIMEVYYGYKEPSATLHEEQPELCRLFTEQRQLYEELREYELCKLRKCLSNLDQIVFEENKEEGEQDAEDRSIG